jgi:hypothetical protein
MANTLNGINLAQIANDTLDYLSTEFHPLRAFVRDFSEDIAQKGESVTTRVASSTTTQDLSDGYDLQDMTSTAKTITLDKFKGHVMGFTDLEVSKSGDAEWLKSVFMAPALEAVLDVVMDDLLALVLAATYTSAETITAANFDVDEIADLASDLSTLKVPKAERGLLLPPTYYASIQKDAIVQDSSSYGSPDAVREHAVRRVHGFNCYEYTGIPANGENLGALALHPSALLLAARQPATPDAPHVQVENVTDPTTGLPLQFRAWYDANAGVAKVSMGTLYGVATGNATALKRITTA